MIGAMMILYESEIEQIALEILHDENGYDLLYGPDMSEGASQGARIHRSYSSGPPARCYRPHQPAPFLRMHAKMPSRRLCVRHLRLSLTTTKPSTACSLTAWMSSSALAKVNPGPIRSGWSILTNPNNNEFLAVNQFTVLENHNNKRPDIVLFINGLPLVVIELKNAADENADVQAAFHQLQTYQQVIPSLFTHNAFLVISDGWFAKIGTISSDYSRFMEWKSVDGKTIVDAKHQSELEPMIKGLLNKQTLLDAIRHFIVFEKTKETTIKKIAAYHQYYAVNRAITSTIRASRGTGVLCRASIRQSMACRALTTRPRETSGPASSGIPRAAARASPWSFTPASWCWRKR